MVPASSSFPIRSTSNFRMFSSCMLHIHLEFGSMASGKIQTLMLTSTRNARTPSFLKEWPRLIGPLFPSEASAQCEACRSRRSAELSFTLRTVFEGRQQTGRAVTRHKSAEQQGCRAWHAPPRLHEPGVPPLVASFPGTGAADRSMHILPWSCGHHCMGPSQSYSDLFDFSLLLLLPEIPSSLLSQGQGNRRHNSASQNA